VRAGYAGGVPNLVGINHLAVPVRDVDEMLAFLGEIFEDVKLRGRPGGMAFVDMGDQFIALESVGKGQTPGQVPGGHIGLVVDDREETVRRARDAGAQMVGGHDFLDPSGNRWQVVDYSDIQFTKAPRILEGMGLSGLNKSERALGELRAKNLAD
jgi:catechol 2,3-dioxygenase-like lactoylglutathione lyase family enzyme